MSEEYMSCHYIESGIVFGNTHISFCCTPNNSSLFPVVAPYGDNESVVEKYLEIRKNSRDTPLTACKNCQLYRRQKWHFDGKIHRINFAYAAPCNFKCEYCFTEEPNYMPLKQVPNVMPLLELLYQKNLVADNCTFALAAGEPAIHKYCDDIIDYSVKVNGRVAVTSNCSVYKNSIAEALKRGNSTLLCSVDAGTKETFELVKGQDSYQKVIDNLREYAKLPGVTSKYIIYDRNYYDSEMISFVKTMHEIGITHIVLHLDARNRFKLIPDEYIRALSLGKFLSESLGISVNLESETYAEKMPNIKQRIETMIKQRIVDFSDIYKDEFVYADTKNSYTVLRALEPALVRGHIESVCNDKLVSFDASTNPRKVTVPQNFPLYIRGWIINDLEKCVFDFVYVSIDNILYKADILERRDIQKLKGEQYLLSGFSLLLHSHNLKPGIHTLKIIGVSISGKRYAALDSVELTISEALPDYSLENYVKNFWIFSRYPNFNYTEPPKQIYLIAATPRSGTNLLTDLLSQTNLAGIPTEYFERFYQDAKSNFANFSIDEYLKHLFKFATTPNGVFGSKDFYKYYAIANFPLEKYNPKYIYVSRRNKLRQAISLYKGVKTKAFGSNVNPKVELTEKDFSYGEILHQVAELTIQDEAWQRYFFLKNINPVYVVYEDFVEDISGTVSNVLKEALDIDFPAEQVPVSIFEKQADELSEYFYNRFLDEAMRIK